MGRNVVLILGAAVLCLLLSSAPATAQVGVAVGIGGPRVGASVIVGAPPVYVVDPFYDPYYYYPYPYRDYRYRVYPRYPVRYGRTYYSRRVGMRPPVYYYGSGVRYYDALPRGGRYYRGNARYGRDYARDGRYSRGQRR